METAPNKKYPYTEVAGTPLKFYKFVRVTLIIGAVFDVLNLLSSFTKFTSDFGDWYNTVYYLINLGFIIAAYIGLDSMKWYGALCYMGIWALGAFDALLTTALIRYSGLTDMSVLTYFTRFVSYVIFLIPVWIYFRKRRLLFAPPPADDPRPPQEPASPMPVSQASDAGQVIAPDAPASEHSAEIK